MDPQPRPLRVVLADDHTLMRTALTEVLRADDVIVTAAESGADALDALADSGADLLVAALHMHAMGGLQLVAMVEKLHPDVPAVILSRTDDPGWMNRAIAVGAEGYVHSYRTDETLRTACRSVMNGRYYFDAELGGSGDGAPVPTGPFR